MSSFREMPSVLPESEHPGHFEVRWVSKCGRYKWKRRQVFVSRVLATEWVRLEEVADGVLSLYFYDRLLARLDERTHKLIG